MKNRKVGGFSLIELMITVAIVGLLAAIAYPAYTTSVLKGRRAQARAALAELLQQQERYLTQRNCYLGFTTTSGGVATPSAPLPSTACGGVTASTVPFKTFSGDTPASASYLLSAENCQNGTDTFSIAECVRVVAQPTGTDPLVGDLRMTSTGIKDCTPPISGITPPLSLCWP